jgi:DNA-binding NarL/FixJ family response regulator
MDIVI